MSGWTRAKLAAIAGITGVTLAGALAGTGSAGAAAWPGAVQARITGTAVHRVTEARQQAADVSDWPMFQDDPTHSGVSPETAIGTANAGLLREGWTATIGTTSYNSPVVATSSTPGESVVYAAAGPDIYAYPATGSTTPLWTFATSGANIVASPAVFDGVVYVGSAAGIVYALNASTGAQLCSYKTPASRGGGYIQAAPDVVSDPDGSGPVLYTGTAPTNHAGAEFAIYGAGNTHGSCKLDWAFNSWAVAGSGTWSPAAYGTDANGNPALVFGSVGPDDAIYSVNATTGALNWRYQTSTGQNLDVGAAPTISAPGQNGLAGGAVYATGKDKVVYALDLTTGQEIWTHSLVGSSGEAVASSALDGSTLYLGSNNGVYALSATTGALVWHVLGGPFYSSPAITGPAGQQVLVIGSVGGNLYALNLADGSTLWTRRPTTSGFWASPAISDGRFFVVSLDGVLRSYAPTGH